MVVGLRGRSFVTAGQIGHVRPLQALFICIHTQIQRMLSLRSSTSWDGRSPGFHRMATAELTEPTSGRKPLAPMAADHHQLSLLRMLGAATERALSHTSDRHADISDTAASRRGVQRGPQPLFALPRQSIPRTETSPDRPGVQRYRVHPSARFHRLGRCRQRLAIHDAHHHRCIGVGSRAITE